MKFEIHITGEKGINKELDGLGIKNIIVELLHPNMDLFRVEYMSSFIAEKPGFNECLEDVLKLRDSLKSKVIRTKIECPIYYQEYESISLYAESHFNFFNTNYPLSRNQRSGRIMGTDREYDKTKYSYFTKKWENEELELCLFDSFIEEDADWFKLYTK